MCRLGFIPNPEDFTHEALYTLFDDLTAAYGGDGVGIGGYRNGVPKLLKGVDLEEAYLAHHAVYGGPWDHGVVYHTRLSTHGGDKDFFCHPFQTPRGFLAHNGIWSDYHEWWPAVKGRLRPRALRMCKGPRGVSDSYVMAQIYKHMTSQAVIDLVDSGVVIIANKGKWPIVHVPSGGDFQIASTPKGWVYASQIPYQWGIDNHVDRVYDVQPQSIVVMKRNGPYSIKGGMKVGELRSWAVRLGPCRIYSGGWDYDDLRGDSTGDDTRQKQRGGYETTQGHGPSPRIISIRGNSGHFSDDSERESGGSTLSDLWNETEYERDNEGWGPPDYTEEFPDLKF